MNGRGRCMAGINCIFPSSKFMPTETDWESVLLATIFKENTGNCLCSCLSMFVSCVLLYCLCGKRCSLVILFFFPGDQTCFSSRSHPLPFSKLLLFPFFPFSNFEYESNFFYPYVSGYSSRIGCLYSSPFVPFHTHPSGFTHPEELLELKLKLCLHPHDAKSPAKQYGSVSWKVLVTFL